MVCNAQQICWGYRLSSRTFDYLSGNVVSSNYFESFAGAPTELPNIGALFNTGVHLAFFVTEVSDCEHACSWVTATPAGARLPPSVRTTAMVICGVSFFRLSSLIQSLFWLAMLRCKTHICSKNIGKGIVLTQPGPHSTYFPALNSASCKCLECEVGGMWS